MGEDLQQIKPTVLIAVPRIFERVLLKVRAGLADKGGLAPQLFDWTVDVGWHRFNYQQQRAVWHPKLLLWPLLQPLVANKIMAKLGGRVRVAVCGGAPLSTEVAKVFIGLGLPLIQGYGLTESSPVISVNRLESNDPASVGAPLRDVEVKIGEQDELLAKSPGIMLGYWRNEEVTRAIVDAQGWLHTGDKATIREGRIYITGRLKDIIVMANGEKVSPADMEAAVTKDGLFEQVMVVGEGRPYLTALVVLQYELQRRLLVELGLKGEPVQLLQHELVKKAVLQRISTCLREFPGYAQIRRIALLSEPWTIENGLLTPTLKLKRTVICETYRQEIEGLYRGH